MNCPDLSRASDREQAAFVAGLIARIMGPTTDAEIIAIGICPNCFTLWQCPDSVREHIINKHQELKS